MRKLLFILMICLLFVAPALAQHRPKMEKPKCEPQGYYDQYSKNYLEPRDCQEPRRMIILEQPYQPWLNIDSPAHRLIYQYGWRNGYRSGR